MKIDEASELVPGGASVPPASGGARQSQASRVYDVAVIGAGSFGAWTAYQLRSTGRTVVLLDAYGPGNGRASSGGESRIIRMGYGPDEIYSRWSMRSLTLWREFLHQAQLPLFHRTGVLWLARASDAYNQHNLEIFQKLGVPHERVSRAELEKRYSQIALGPVTWGLLETEGGVLMARRAVQAVVEESVKNGVDYVPAAVVIASARGKLSSLTTTGGAVRAEIFVFACGPWLPKLFPPYSATASFRHDKKSTSSVCPRATVDSRRRPCPPGSALVMSSTARRISKAAVSKQGSTATARHSIPTPAHA